MVALNTNVDFSETRGPEVNIVGGVLTGVAIVAVLLRLYARVEVVKRVGWDDFFIVFSLVCRTHLKTDRQTDSQT